MMMGEKRQDGVKADGEFRLAGGWDSEPARQSPSGTLSR
jgi:hypothetical protein